MRKVALPFSDEALVMLSEECGHEDGKIGARFKPPVTEIQRAVDAYGRDYWNALAAAPLGVQMEPDKRLVRRARMTVVNKLLRERRRAENAR